MLLQSHITSLKYSWLEEKFQCIGKHFYYITVGSLMVTNIKCLSNVEAAILRKDFKYYQEVKAPTD